MLQGCDGLLSDMFASRNRGSRLAIHEAWGQRCARELLYQLCDFEKITQPF